MEVDEDAIRAIIATYQEAGRLGSRELYRRAFHPSAVVCSPSNDGGSLVEKPIEAFADEVAEMVAAGVRVEETTRDLRIDVSGDVAHARIVFVLRIGDESFEGTDHMNLVRLNGAWLIAHKLYDMAPVGNG